MPTIERLRREVRRFYPNADAGILVELLRACRTTRLPVAFALALLEKETTFRNVFGHDPTSSIPDGWKGGKVTRARYRWYKARRRLGKGMQGVGPTQLTWFAFQDQADKLGGCWRPYPNMVVGFRILRENIDRLGEERGAAAFNGTGDAARDYGRDFVAKRRRWAERLS